MSVDRLTAMEYELSANRHRPDSLDGFAPTIRGLHEQGLQVRDIALALRLSDAEVANAIGDEVR